MDPSNPMAAVIPSLEGQVLRVLAGTTKPMTTATVAALVTRGTYPGVRAALLRLTEVGTVLQDQVGTQLQYLVNREHLAWPAIQHAAQFADGFRRELFQRLHDLTAQAVEHEDEHAGLVTVAVFGSVARGEAAAGSDLDVVIVFPPGLDETLVEDLADQIARNGHTWTGNLTNPMVLDADRLQEMVDLGDPLVQSWIQDALTVHGPDLRHRLTKDQP